MSSDGKRQLIIGMTGSGKTKYTQRLIAKIPRLIIFDPKRSYRKVASSMGLVTFGDIEALHAYLVTHKNGRFRVLYEPEPEHEVRELHNVSVIVEALQEDFANELDNKKTMLVVEEAHTAAPNPPTKETKKLNGFARLNYMGREWGVDILTVLQMPQDVAMYVRNSVNRVACFMVANEDAIRASAKSIPRRGVEAAIEGLEKYHHVYFDDEAETYEVKPPIAL